ncbi:hypothetical protein V2J09_021855 [Rumex salicifolius]
MMKLLALQNANRRNNSFRGSSVLDGGLDGGIKSPATFWTVLHWLCCIISLLLGFRFSRLVLFLLLSTNPSSTTTTTARFDSTNTPFGAAGNLAGSMEADATNRTFANGMVSGSRVVVGRHGIRIRPWPHPNPEEVMRAHRILERVQREQRLQYGVKEPRTLIVITPTYVRTFQTLHLTGVMHSLMNSPYEVFWIVVEAGGKTNETAYLLEKSGVQTIHIGYDHRMPVTWGDRQMMENRMRLLALRVVRERKLDGIVMFADDSNMHNMELFDEIQKVRGIGAVSVGILMHTGGADEPLPVVEDEAGSLPVQGPSCNASDALVGWHTFNASPYAERSAVYIGDVGPILPMRFEWAGFVLNSRLLWKEDVDKPEWMKDLDSLNENEVESPLSLVSDASVVEPLGSCGRKILLWWLRVEARSDSKFPSRWIIDTPLEITVPAKRTPWPDAPPELPSIPKVTASAGENADKRPPKSRTSRSKRSRNKRKRDPRTTDTLVSSRQTQEK